MGDEFEKAEEMTQSVEYDRADAERSLRKIESTLRIEKQRMEQVEKQTLADLEQQEAALETMRAETLAAPVSNDQCAELNVKLQDVKQRTSAELATMQREVTDMLEKHNKDREHVSQVLT